MTSPSLDIILRSPFDYSKIPGLKIWLEAKFVEGVANGAAVATWPEKASGLNPTQGTVANQPLFIRYGTNGQPVLRFDATNDSMTSTISGLTGSNGATLFVVSKFAAAGGTRALFDSSDGAVTNRGLLLFMSAANLVGRWVSGGASYAFSDTTRFHIHTVNHQAATRTIFLDGTVQNTEVTTPTNTTPTTYTIGTLTGATNPANSDIAAVLLWTRSLTLDEQRRVERELSQFYGVPSA